MLYEFLIRVRRDQSSFVGPYEIARKKKFYLKNIKPCRKEGRERPNFCYVRIKAPVRNDLYKLDEKKINSPGVETTP